MNRADCVNCRREIEHEPSKGVWRHVGSNLFTCAFTRSDYKGREWPMAVPKEGWQHAEV